MNLAIISPKFTPKDKGLLREITMKLYNTLTRTTETIKPLESGKIKMYTCGLTVYSHPQIGNWVAYIYSDVLTRTLKGAGFNVIRVQNITDVGHLVSDDDSGEDKMEKGARAEGLTAWDVAEKYIAIANEESEQLGLLKPDKLVRATALIDEQIQFVQELEKRGYTYAIEHEGIYFDTSKLNDYGKLAKLDIEGLQAGARVEVHGKKNPTDFALWKFSPTGQKRDMEWESPWGIGFPGWHLECSVIARVNLGDQLDIHTGGIDHIPVHHTNEIAQTEAITNKQFVKYWFHNNHMKINGTKMSKSLGNSYSIGDIRDKGYSLNAVKLMILSSHYRTEGNFTWEILDAAQNRYLHWQALMNRKWQSIGNLASNPDDIVSLTADAIHSMKDTLENDLDTPNAFRILDETVTKLEDLQVDQHSSKAIELLETFLANALGITFHNSDISATEKKILEERQSARDRKDFAKSDELRDALLKTGITVNDTPQGPVWSRTTTI